MGLQMPIWFFCMPNRHAEKRDAAIAMRGVHNSHDLGIWRPCTVHGAEPNWTDESLELPRQDRRYAIERGWVCVNGGHGEATGLNLPPTELVHL